MTNIQHAGQQEINKIKIMFCLSQSTSGRITTQKNLLLKSHRNNKCTKSSELYIYVCSFHMYSITRVQPSL